MNVLLVDDHDLLRAGTALCLKSLFPGVRVFEASSCPEAIELARREVLDLVLLDVGFPGRPNDGIAALVRLKRECESLCVVMHSGRICDRQLVMDCLAKGAMGFIPKGSRDEFVEGLRVVLMGRPYLPRLHAYAGGRGTSSETLKANLDNTKLTPTLRRLFPLFVQGKSYKAMAAELGLAPQTIKNYMRTIFDEFGVSNRTEPIVELVARGWLSGD
ncbi:MAG: response regulator transcription factor [Rhodocyclaceae bacterium]|nr:response regulator transcription factor [Rhodocyclaceae bacterium]